MPPLHPLCEEFIDRHPLVAAWRDLGSMTPEKARALASLEPSTSNIAMQVVREIDIDGSQRTIHARVYRPASAALPGILVWVHGGGFVVGSLDTAESECRALAAASGCLVLSPEYRLAPENPFPAALIDCYDVIRWVASHRAELDAAGLPVALGGESAGGTLAAAVTLMARRHAEPAIAFQVLVCPTLSPDGNAFPSRTSDDGLYPTDAMIQWCWDHYLGHPTDRRDPLACPLLAESLEGLPPALVVTAEYDPLRDEGETYAHRLVEADVFAEHLRCPGVIHGLFAWTQKIPSAIDCLTHIGNWAAGRFTQTP